jgi:hypothetical protein
VSGGELLPVVWILTAGKGVGKLRLTRCYGGGNTLTPRRLDTTLKRERSREMPVQRAYIAVISWIDGEVEDADELRVFAESAESAKSLAKEIWLRAKSPRWPTCRISSVEVFPQARLSSLA